MSTTPCTRGPELTTLRKLNSLSAVTVVQLPRFSGDGGDLTVFEALTHVPFEIARVFVVRAPEGGIRGRHAHRECAQFLTCPAGRVKVLCDDGAATATFVLDGPSPGLLIPPGIWAQQTYEVAGSVLAVLCDRPFDAGDYIRDYAEFKAYRQSIDPHSRDKGKG